MKKVSMSITIFPDVYQATVSDIESGRHNTENELIDAALRSYLGLGKEEDVELISEEELAEH